MVDSFVVVAIPSQDDYVWKISSEKVPHLTLLYLDANLENLAKVEEFIGHVVDTSLNKFMLDVSDRGVLGDKSADVVFFNKRWYCDNLEDFRSYLLTNDDIAKAYNSVEQYDSWTPHLTLGYPETPAKPDDREYPGIRWVNFDRIALWTGDYEGVEFPLKNIGEDVAMSETIHKGELFLEHFGVKGMRWGVVKAKVTENPVVKYASSSEDHKAVKKIRLKGQLVGPRTLSNKDLQNLIKRMDLEVKYKDLKSVKHKQSLLGMGANWVGKVATNILINVASSYLGRPGFGRSKASPATGPVHYPSHVGRPMPRVQAPVRVINGTTVPPRAIGR